MSINSLMRRDLDTFKMPSMKPVLESDVILNENQNRDTTVEKLMESHSRELENSQKNDGQTVRKPSSKYRHLLDTVYIPIIGSVVEETKLWNSRFAASHGGKTPETKDLLYARLDWRCKNLKSITGSVPSDEDFQSLRMEIKALLDREVPHAQEQLHSICEGKSRLEMQKMQLGSHIETVTPERGTEQLQMSDPVPEHLTFIEQLQFINESCGNVDVDFLASFLA